MCKKRVLPKTADEGRKNVSVTSGAIAVCKEALTIRSM